MGLTIYKASAGSGKTFTLVREYLKLLLEGDKDAYRSILVATFTNKATTELRERIVRKLRELIDQGDSQGKKAKEVLEQILLDYDSLRVQTIDSFFQEVVRSFAFELMQTGTNASADIELDSDAAIELSVDQLLVRLDSEEMEWIEELLKSKVDEGERVDLRKRVVELAKKLLYNPNAKGRDLSQFDAKTVKSAMAELTAKREDAMSRIQQPFGKLWDWLERHVELLPYSAYGFLESIYNSDVEDFVAKKCSCPDKPFFHGSVNIDKDGFIIPKKPKDSVAAAKLLAEEDDVRSLLKAVEEALNAEWWIVQLCDMLLEYMGLLPLFRGLQLSIKQYQEEHNVVLIDEVNLLLDKVIDGASAPFIYERVGGRIRHYMIDEFQDTSSVQWDNFRALLLESIAQVDSESKALESFVVGDVKQSIYRWRGTDSSLLNSGVQEDPEFAGQVTVKSLEDNWRSDHNIVEFNNQFFFDSYQFETHTKGGEPTRGYEKIYCPNEEREVKQGKKFQGGEGKGYVRFEQVGGEELEERLRDIITTLQRDEGYQAGDIAFLVRTNDEAVAIADMLSEFARNPKEGEEPHYFAFLSDLALLINNARVVRLLTSLFQLLGDPNNHNYQTLFEVSCVILGVEHLHERLQEIASNGRSLLEVAHKVLREIEVPEGEELYVNAFLDLLLEFKENNISTFQQFGEWWQRAGIKSQVAMGNGISDRIQIITIHKAKGLEFPIVIMPYAGWPYYNNQPTIEILDKSDLPKDFLKSPLDFYLINGTPYEKCLHSLLSHKFNEYLEDIYLDQLNLLYVAFTRAIHRLYLFTDKGESVSHGTANIIHNRLKEIQGGVSNAQVWEFGERTPKLEEPTEVQDTLILRPQYDRSSTGIPDLKVSKPTTPSIEYGVTMHDAMSRALTPEQFEAAIHRLAWPNEEQIIAQFQQSCQDPMVASWFTPTASREILVEQSIGTSHGIYRPDRVVLEGSEATVIDFKFAHPLLEHRAQVMKYMELLQGMGYTVKGYLWYWHQAQPIVEVTLDR